MKNQMNLHRLYSHVINSLQTRPTLKQVKTMPIRGARRRGREATATAVMALILFIPLLPTPFTPPVHAWSWDEEEGGAKDELDIQLEGYRKRVEQGISLQERIVLLDRLIK